MLKVSGLDVFYGLAQALFNVNIEVKEGSITVVVGPNGAGKSTLLKTIAGILKPKKGIIFYKGARIDMLDAHTRVEKGIVLIPEGRHLFPELTVLDNLKLGNYPKRARDKWDDLREWVFQLFPILKERMKQKTKTLSGGEQQMLAIARGLMSNPEILMLDEPSLGLAPKYVQLIFNTIEQIRQNGLSILLVEQNVASALEMADYAYLLENGSIVMHGRGSELLSNSYVKKSYLGL